MNNWHWLLLIPSCVGIAVIDNIIFSKWNTCINCGHVPNKWYNFLLPTFIEVLLFLTGVGIGAGVLK